MTRPRRPRCGRRGPAEPVTIAWISLGCPKNLVDSEKALGLLASRGAVVCADPADAEVIIVNTCAFIDAAERESRDVIAEFQPLRRGGKRLFVTGCLPARYGQARRPQGTDRAFGVLDAAELSKLAKAVFGEKDAVAAPACEGFVDAPRLRTTPRHYAYLRLTEGCDNRCAYCTIPAIRGPLHSRPEDAILREARELASDGAKELILIGQDTTAYGMDRGGAPRLADLIEKLAEIRGAEWLRLMYAHPAHLDDSVIALLARSERLCPYLDLPLQHIADKMLSRMGRQVTGARVRALIEALRERVPGIALRTTLMVGFPGETEEEFAELVRFVEQVRFEHLGVFRYSPEAGTPAADFTAQVPDDVREARRDRLMELARRLSLERNRARVGERVRVLTDYPGEQPDTAVGRTAAEAPDVDPVVFVQGPGLAAGGFVECEIIEARPYDVLARVVKAGD